jgi:hypothetical protein
MSEVLGESKSSQNLGSFDENPFSLGVQIKYLRSCYDPVANYLEENKEIYTKIKEQADKVLESYKKIYAYFDDLNKVDNEEQIAGIDWAERSESVVPLHLAQEFQEYFHQLNNLLSESMISGVDANLKLLDDEIDRLENRGGIKVSEDSDHDQSLETELEPEPEPKSSRCFYLKPGPRFFSGVKTTVFTGAFATATIGTVGSVLTQGQNGKLFQLLPENIRESTISTLTAACQNVKGNYATYIAAAVAFIIIMAAVLYYNRVAIKEKLGLGPGNYQSLKHDLLRA